MTSSERARAEGGAMPSRLPERRSATARSRQREIIEAAAEVFYASGYGAASVKEVAERVGLLKGSLYHYIGGKEDLLYQLLVETNESALEIIDELEASGLVGRAALHEFVVRYTAYNCRNRKKVSVYYRDIGLVSAERFAAVLDQRARFEAYVDGLIRRARDDGEVTLDPADDRLTTMFIFGATNWAYQWFDPQGPRSAEDIGALYADLVVGALDRPHRTGPSA